MNHIIDNNRENKRLIGILAGHDAPERSNQLVQLLIDLYKYLKDGDGREEENSYQTLEWFFTHYHFVLTGGTFSRLILGYDPGRKKMLDNPLFKTLRSPENKELRELIISNSTILPPYFEGGIILLTQLVVQRQLSILWSFLTPFGSHWIIPENLALLRLCDLNNVKKQMNYGSALEWVRNSLYVDSLNNLSSIPIIIYPGCDKGFEGSTNSRDDVTVIKSIPSSKNYAERYLYSNTNENCVDTLSSQIELLPSEINSIIIPRYDTKARPDGRLWYHQDERSERTIALIAHDGMKDRMVSFAVDFEDFLSGYKRIVTTNTTGEKIKKTTRKLTSKIDACFSGPKGGDIEIATQILMGDIQTVVFFIDPTSAHAHIDDIRVVFGAAMMNPHARMLTNERQARQRFHDVVIKEGMKRISFMDSI